MPTVMVPDGYRVVIYPNDHRSAHVHVIGKGGEAVFVLQTSSSDFELREAYGLSAADLRWLFASLLPHQALLLAKWEAIHGPIG